MRVQRERVRVSGIDTDAGGRIHFTAVFRWVEIAEAQLIRELGAIDEWWQYPRRRVEVDYLRPMRFDDELEVAIWAERIGRSSITWRWTIVRAGELCAQGMATVVRVDASGTPIEVSSGLREALVGD